MESSFLHVAQQAIFLTVVISAPPLLAALAAGLSVAVVQALTQIQEQTVQLVCRLTAIFAVLGFMGYWMASELLRFAVNILESFPELVG